MAGRFIPAQEGGFIVSLRNLPNGWSQGENRDEALAQAEDLRGIRPL
jgi:predicted RNase H-like HicB family nuclease